MEKSIAEIMSEPATVEEIIRQATAINKMIDESKKAGVIWPELNNDDDEPTQ